MNKKEKLLMAFLVILGITTILYLMGVSYYTQRPISKDAFLGNELDVAIFTIFFIPVYLVELDMYFAVKSLSLNWSSRSGINKMVNIIACIVPVIMLLLISYLVMREQFGIYFAPDKISLYGLLLIIGNVLLVELGLGLVRLIVFRVEKVRNI